MATGVDAERGVPRRAEAQKVEAKALRAKKREEETAASQEPGHNKRPARRIEAVRSLAGALERLDVLGLGTLGPLGDVELDLLVLVQGLVTAGGDCRIMCEHVSASVVGG